MKENDVLWSGPAPYTDIDRQGPCGRHAWPVKPPVNERCETSGLWNRWVQLKKMGDAGEPVAAMIAVDSYIKNGKPVPRELAKWFNDSFELYWSDSKTKAKNRISLDMAFGFKNTKGKSDAMAGYATENIELLSTMRMLIENFRLKKSVSARVAIAYHDIAVTDKWARDLYTNTQNSGNLKHLRINGKPGCYFLALEIAKKTGRVEPNDSAKVEKAAEKFRIEKMGDTPREQLIAAGKEWGYITF